jgi:polysaccharide deacetylase family protein (PEP-CTERM system associated)
MIRNALTVDVEDYFHVSAFAESINRNEWDSLPLRVGDNTRRLLDLFERNHLKATFFVLGWVAERMPELIRDIAEHGHEIACHGLTHQLVYNQSPEQFRSETLQSKQLLEDITGLPVHGYRAASYSITDRSRWALDILAEAGFVYDSSIFPVRHDRYGMPGSPEDPYNLTTENGNTLVEFPLSTARVLGYRLPVAGGGYFRLYPYALTRTGLRQINRKEKPFIFYLHPWEIDPDQPRIDAKWLSRFRHYNNISRCEQRLNRLFQDFSFDTAYTILGDLDLIPG